MNFRNGINSNYMSPSFYYTENNERFIWPLIPFLGGAAIGYFAGRPQYNYTYPVYYPVYYPPYYGRPYSQMYNSYSYNN